MVAFAGQVSADTFTGGSYKIDASVIGNSFGGDASGGSYKLTGSGGESIIGQGSGGSYKLDSGYVAQLPHSMQLTVQPGGLVAYYPLDETSGTLVNDESANTNDGAALNALTVNTGKIGGSFLGDGTSQEVTIPSSVTANNIETFTIALWAKPTATTAGADILSKWSGTTGVPFPYALRILIGGRVSFVVYDGTNTISVTSTSALSTSQWKHIAVTRTKGGPLKVYIDGIEEAIGTDTLASTASAASPLTIGYRSGATPNYFPGYVDEVKLFNRVLTATEIKAEYDAQNAGIPSGLSLNTITPGASNTAPYDAIVQTDTSGYNLAVNQNQDLTKGSDTIPAVSGSIASPVAWAEGTTKGLGFTLYGTNATAIPGKWNSGSSYAAFPGTATTYYTRSGYTAGAKDYLNMRLRLDVAMSQISGTYTNTITTTATGNP